MTNERDPQPGASRDPSAPGSLDVAGAAAALLVAATTAGIPHEVRRHPPARHARHLAAIWGLPLSVATRATLFGADGRPVLVLVPADRKVGAPRLRDLLGASDLRVLRADRGVGRVGWSGLPGEPGALPALAAPFGARLLVDALVLEQPDVVLALEPGRSLAVAPTHYLHLTRGETVSVAGRTRLLPEGGMVHDPA